MALTAPNLDDRTFQDIVSAARSKIPQYCPKWTDYNLSDPGVTVIELFAWMTDMLLYRLNRVPDKTYIKFMDLLGIRLEPPKPASADITFRLSAPQTWTMTIPANTEVATKRSETQEAINFTTVADLVILVPTLAHALTTGDEKTFADQMPALKNRDVSFAVFSPVPKEIDALYIGFTEDLRHHTLALTVDCRIEGIGVDPRDPPLAWEFWDGGPARWAPARVETDTTGGLNQPGRVILHLPDNSAVREVNGVRATWLRCRALKPRPDQRAYTSSPKIKNIVVESLGGTVRATQCFRVNNELLGRSTGLPGQKFNLRSVPVLPREPGEMLEVETEREGTYEEWHEVSDFAASGPDDRHYTLDEVTGEVQFGPILRQPSGEERRYGRVPPKGRMVRFTTYRWGGGVVGNVGERTITVLKSSVPYVAAVTNFTAAAGGTDAETLDRAKLRTPSIVRARTRAVTAEDFECLAMEASPLVARAHCVAAGSPDGHGPPPGVVRLLLVPAISDTARFIPADELELPRRLREDVQAYLDERRLLATHLEIGTPQYQPVAVVARIKVKEAANAGETVAAVETRVYGYLNPVSGGAEGGGLGFGRGVTLSEVYAAIQGAPGLDYVEDVKLFPLDPKTGERQEAVTRVAATVDGLVCSAKHEVVAV